MKRPCVESSAPLPGCHAAKLPRCPLPTASPHHHLPLSPPPQVDRDTLEMLKAINMGALPGVTVAAAVAPTGGAGGFKGGFRGDRKP